MEAYNKKVKQDIVNKKKDIEVIRKNVERYESEFQLKCSLYETKQDELVRLSGGSVILDT